MVKADNRTAPVELQSLIDGLTYTRRADKIGHFDAPKNRLGTHKLDLTDRATERQLRDYDQAGVITAAKIAKSDDGFIVVIQVSWKRGDIVVYNQRNKPRAWRSLDRLVVDLFENPELNSPESYKRHSCSAQRARNAESIAT